MNGWRFCGWVSPHPTEPQSSPPERKDGGNVTSLHIFYQLNIRCNPHQHRPSYTLPPPVLPAAISAADKGLCCSSHPKSSITYRLITWRKDRVIVNVLGRNIPACGHNPWHRDGGGDGRGGGLENKSGKKRGMDCVIMRIQSKILVSS